ncbi:mRNA interferase YafQ [Lebetimonas natsushimae]|uniref:mRNA interferase YafQ n=1 Tax=Lebetimonas natsushimae TaxID=1936991 RepID=A0A292Y885_9BACT|nr:type II toxin-antitoxin system YafQ family toxin [Lebetimonas natsushimae]GAX87002.1 mRNA interferase YafQ [Lebetimonas natsushimae]
MLTLKRHKQFIKDFNKIKITDTQFQKFINYISLLLNNKELPAEARDHFLTGEWSDTREFHVGGDLLVIYIKTDKDLILIRIGTHSQLFK